MEVLHSWPEPVVPVQSLADRHIAVVPEIYIKPPEHRPSFAADRRLGELCIPVIDLGDLEDGIVSNPSTVSAVSTACREWGFFQLVNHGVSSEAMGRIMRSWRQFFSLPMEDKLRYSNTPKTYEGYGSRLGIEKGAILDWGDYFFLHLRPLSLKDPNKWPTAPPSCREAIEEYCEEGIKLYKMLMKLLSISLGMDVNYLMEKFGGEEFGATMRVNHYPKCPQPEFTLGLSPHSDPGTITVLLADHHVKGLQVRHRNEWITVDPVPGALIVNLGDQMQVLTNAVYKSVEHRVLVNSSLDRQSVVLFFNPKSDVPIAPAEEFVPDGMRPAYQPMTYDEYRMFVRKRGPEGKIQVNSLMNIVRK